MRRYGPTPRLLATVANLCEIEADVLCGADAVWTSRTISEADAEQARHLRAMADAMRERAERGVIVTRREIVGAGKTVA